ncbi:MAG TPA: gluconate 2-dehydrogenase subunit 3 family protein [Longimicrobiales bacterium]|nr:gluconate 2-dehydrogenase subunit 3 family protein [Longimicrobiales bacterium]
MSEERKDRMELPVVGMDRREALKLLALAAAAPAALTACGPGEEGAQGGDAAATGDAAGPRTAAASNPLARGDAWDPDLVNPVLRWEKVLTQDERDGLAALCDVIIPADERSPSASSVGAHDYIDEWVSAPYDFGRNDLVLVRGGLGWLDAEAARRFGDGKRFRDLADAEKAAVCDDICYLPRAREEHRMPARFFAKVRDLTATAFYTTREGMQDIGYVGNLPTTAWGPPPPEVLRHLGLA